MLLNPYRFASAAPVGVTLNPADMATGGVLSNGNRTLSKTGGTTVCARATVGATSGLRYFEARLDTVSGFAPAVGLQDSLGSLDTDIGQEAREYGLRADGSIYRNGSYSPDWTTAFTTGAVIMVAVNFTSKRIWFGRNGTWLNSGDPVAGTNPAATFTTTNALFPVVQVYGSTVVTARFAAGDLSYPLPSGYSVW